MIKSTIALCLLCVPALAEPVELAYRFDTNAPVRYEMVQKMEQTHESPGMTIEISTTTTSQIKTKLIETRDDGTLVIGNTTEKIMFEMHGAGIDLSYDSENPDDESKLADPTIASLAILKGFEVQLHLDRSGTILDVPNIDQIKDNVLDMQDPSMWEMAEAMTNEETIIAMNEANYKFLPTGPVNIGDQWNREFVIPTGDITITMKFLLTLEAITGKDDDQIAEISIAGSMHADYGPELNEVISLIESNLSGTTKFHIHDGLFDSLLLNSTFVTESNFTGGDEPDMSITINQTLTNTRLDD